MKPLDPHSLRTELSAFVDGELDRAASERLLLHLVANPEAMETLRHLQRLTADAGRVVRVRTPPPSESLRESVRQLTGAEPQAKSSAPRPQRSSRMDGWWVVLPQAAAALLLLVIGIGIGHHSSTRDRTVLRPGLDTTGADVIPAAFIAQAEEIHGFCSRLAEGLHTAGYPEELAPLASSVEHDLHSDRPYPDLGAIGYRYRGAGPCGVPLGDTVHLLYRSTRPGSVEAVSVFVQPWHGQFPLDEGRLYTVSVATSPFPMLAWRTDRVVYYLLADNATTLTKAATLIRGKPTSGPAIEQ
jgi:anti-sigma factor RsiW